MWAMKEYSTYSGGKSELTPAKSLAEAKYGVWNEYAFKYNYEILEPINC